MATRAPRCLTTAAVIATAVAVLSGTPGATAVTATTASVVLANPDDLAPVAIDGEVLAHAQIGHRIYVAGTFTTIRNANTTANITRRALFAYDATTGRIDNAFAPVVNHNVHALATDGVSLFIGGRFTAVNGVVKNRLTKLNPATGAPLSWHGNANGVVDDLAFANGTLFVGGTFTKLRNVERFRLGAFNTASGQLDGDLTLKVERPGWIGKTDVSVTRLAATPDGTRLVIAGSFHIVGGQLRRQIAMIDRTTSPDTVSAWNQNDGWGEPSPGFTCIHDVAFSPDGSFFVVPSMCGDRPLGDAIARFETATEMANAQPTWVNWTGWDTLWGATVTDAAVYVGGHQKSMNSCRGCGHTSLGAVPREGLAALDPLNGVPLSWNPGRERGVGAKAMTAIDAGLLVGHDTNLVGGEWHPRHAFFASGTPAPVHVRPTLPATMTRVDANGAIANHFDGSNAPIVPAPAAALPTASNQIRSAFVAADKFYAISLVDGRLKSWTFDGISFGPEVDVLNSGGYWNPNWISFASTPALTYDNGWLYEVNAAGQLVRRGFSLESGIIGSQSFLVSGPGADGWHWGPVQAIAIAGDHLYMVTNRGELRRMQMVGTVPMLATDTAIGGPGIDGVDYNATSLLITTPTMQVG